MAGRVRQEDLTAVRERTDIVKVVSGHLQLKKAARDSLVGICPFHPEKTPSFSVSPSKQLYYCFGCGEGGDVFRFLEKAENLSFSEAVEKLARDIGLTLRYEGETPFDRRTHGRRQALHRVVAEAAQLYHRMLREGREGSDARDYLASRGISEATIERFAVGYAPGYPDFLLKRLSRAHSVDLLVEAGLVAKGADGGLRDRFRGRVMFPIHDASGNAVGFGGRLLGARQPSTGGAKYVNSPDGSLYHKARLLYNIHRAKADITRSGRAWLVEGYTDVIALDQAGVTEAVATCGTALGEEHIRMLARFTERIVLAFDSDEAGARAAERAFQFHERYPVEVSVLVLPQGQDPADYALAHGEAAGEAFRALEEHATPLVVYMIHRVVAGRNLGDVEEQARTVQSGVALLAGLTDPVRRDRYARVLADKAGVNVTTVLLALERPGGAATAGPGAAEERPPPRLPPAQKVEREALKLLVQWPDLCAGRIAELGMEHFTRAEHRKAFEFIREKAATEPRSLGASLATAAQTTSEQLVRLFAALAVEPLATVGDVTDEYAQHVFLRLEEFALKGKVDEIRKRLERLNPLKATGEYDELYDEFVRLEEARRRVRAAQEMIGAVSSS